ncbi:MAG TPA: hypothetical protein VGM90_21940 [Kofleriaceae bacterium]|jgi:hypothetical protein
MRWLPLLLFATGCGTMIQATAINPTPHPLHARPPESVLLFSSGPPQGRRYTDVAYLEAEQESGYSVDNTPQFITKLRERAAVMGCDGLVLGGTTNATTVGIDLKTAMNQKGLVATCIVFDDPPTMASVAP